ncbi:CDP-glycerol glycerophosphotransferase family protein [Pseudoalteromonas marina]|uniref:CDP-glycerol glycerophosphotransferase family protein n=1 Tax=Pseudoalteromonas marina TaxID=267375 RepID=UPI000231896B|nr:CDP-glycerol glycerophosphotransferase family protein [Pseudoalteromonas sp. BSi20480]GAA75691.1 CDP-glycerol: N-acetyl-beta-D-mannosaminyl-1, 4-N-acetyl-D-glucosaminyldiphosphoundecaprenyl glycerophosphotransferase [Pseudoalteromonas sp. BSi20480]
MNYLTTTKNKKYLMYISQNYSYAILRPIQAAILANGGQVRWFLQGSSVNPDFLTPDEIRLNSIDDIHNWKPDATFAPANLIPTFFPGIKVGVFHGFDAGKLDKKGNNDHLKARGCFDLYCTQGPNTTVPFKALQKKLGYFKVTETGWPTLDRLFTGELHTPYTSKADTRPTLLICSTFSKRLSLAPKLYEQIKHFSETGKWRILMQFHPKMPIELVNKYKALSNQNLTFIETDDVVPLLKSADVMLCDTSSVLLMFIVQRKPVVTFCNNAPDKHLLNVTDPNKLEDAIDLAFTYPKTLMQNIESYCQQLHPYTDGKSSERVVAATNEFLLSDEKLKPKPFNIIRQFKTRKNLNYWKW